MAAEALAERVGILEREVERLKLRLDEAAPPRQPWWERVHGAFTDDPVFDEAMQLGREYRESLRPKDGDERDSHDVPT